MLQPARTKYRKQQKGRNRGVATRGHRLEASRVLAVAGQDLVALCGVHDGAIGPYPGQL